MMSRSCNNLELFVCVFVLVLVCELSVSKVVMIFLIFMMKGNVNVGFVNECDCWCNVFGCCYFSYFDECLVSD